MQEHPDQMKLEDEPFLKGTVQAVIFHNESNLYSVLKVKVIETSENLEEKTASVTGYFPALHEEETYTFYGKVTSHPKFGEQFQATHFQRKSLQQSKASFIISLVTCLKGLEKRQRKKSSAS